MSAKKSVKAFEIPTSIDLEMETRHDMIELLNQHLADTFDLLSHTKQAHWNVKGPQFMDLHKLFDELAAGVLEHVDTIAERVTALGGVASGTVRMAAANTRLPEYLDGAADGPTHVRALVERYAALAKTSRAAIDTADEAGDMGTADLFTVLVRDLDKWLWFLEAHVQM